MNWAQFREQVDCDTPSTQDACAVCGNLTIYRDLDYNVPVCRPQCLERILEDARIVSAYKNRRPE